MWQTVASKAASTATGKKVDFSTRTHLTLTTAYEGPMTQDVLAAYAIQRLRSYRKVKTSQVRNQSEEQSIHEDPEKPEALTGSPYAIEWPQSGDGCMKAVWKIVTLPLTVCMKFTIPDVRFASVQKICGGYFYF